jgi:acetolactate synthase-1/3 small subunit
MTTQPASAYFLVDAAERETKATLAILVDNEVGALARVVGLFSGRGYNIESLTVAETDHQKHTSRITIVTRGTPAVIEQIKAQLGRLIPVQRVVDLRAWSARWPWSRSPATATSAPRPCACPRSSARG